MGLGKSKSPRVYEPYTSFDVLPTEYFNRRQGGQQSYGGGYGMQQQQYGAPYAQQQYGYQGQSSIQLPPSQLVYRSQAQQSGFGYQAPQSTQVFSKQPSSGAVQYVQVKPLPSSSQNPQPTPTYAPSQIASQQPQPVQQQPQQQQPVQQQPIVRGSSGGISMPPNQSYYMQPSMPQPQRQVMYTTQPQQQIQSVPKFNQQPQVQVVGQRMQ